MKTKAIKYIPTYFSNKRISLHWKGIIQIKYSIICRIEKVRWVTY